METVKILEKPTSITWDYDEEADVLYVSVGDPRAALGIDIGDGLVRRYDEARNEVAGLTVIGLRERLLRELSGGWGGRSFFTSRARVASTLEWRLPGARLKQVKP